MDATQECSTTSKNNNMTQKQQDFITITSTTTYKSWGTPLFGEAEPPLRTGPQLLTGTQRLLHRQHTGTGLVQDYQDTKHIKHKNI